MKRLPAIILTLILVISLSACGLPSNPEIKQPSHITTNDNEDGAQQNEQTKEPSQAEVTIHETVLVDEAGIKITATGLESDAIFGSELKLLIENNSGKDLTFQCRNASINGYMAGTVMSVNVASGKKANDSLTFMEADLEACKIDAIADMEIAFHIFDTSNWKTYLDTSAIQVKTSIADTYPYRYDDSGNLAYEGNGVKIVVKGLSEESSILGPSIVVYIENTSGQNLTVQTRDVSINGFMVNATFSCEIAAGKRAVDAITFLESDLEKNGITAITDVELSFHIFDSETWNTTVDTGAIQIAF